MKYKYTKHLLIRVSFFISIIFLFNLSGYTQPILNNTGLPFIENYSRSEFNGGTQTWSITQDDRGVLYFANNSGVLEFDGTDWRKFPMLNSSVVRKVFRSSEGRIYIGAFNEFGYLFADGKGKIHYHSLSERIASEFKEFGEIWSIAEHNNGIIFQSFSSTYYFKDSVSVINYGKDLNFGYTIGDIYYYGNSNTGIEFIENGEVQYLNGSDLFKNTTISGISELSDGSLLIGTSYDGFYIKQGKSIKKWNTEISAFIKKNQLYRLLEIGNNTYVAGTIKNGIAFFNEKGQVQRVINKESGLQNNSVLSIFKDKDQNLWIGLDNGIDLLKLNSPVSMLFKPDEYGTGYASMEYGNSLYFGTNQGLYASPKAQIIHAKQKANLQLIENTSGQVWNLQTIDNHLICGHHNGLFEIIDNKAIQLSELLGFWKVLKLPGTGNFAIASTYTGLVLLEYSSNTSPGFKVIKKLEGFQESCREMVLDDRGNIWLSHPYRGIFKLALADDLQSIKKINYYDEQKGLPSNYNNYVTKLNNSIYALTDKCIYSYNYKEDLFEPNPEFSQLFNSQPINRISVDNYNNLWYFQDNELGIVRSNFEGSYYAEKVPFNELKNSYIPYYEHIYSIDNQILLVSNEYGFLAFDKTINTQGNKNFNVLIRSLTSTSGEIIYHGTTPALGTGIPTSIIPEQIPVLPNKENSIKIEASALVFTNQNKITYNFWLEGYEKEWSGWTFENRKEYTKLKGGPYTIHVKARNQFNIESNAESKKIYIKKPWYWTTYAIFSYTVIVLVLIYLVYRWIHQRVEKQKQKLIKKQQEDFEKKQKQLEYDNILNEKEIIRLKNENLLIENDRNKALVENKTKELASIAMKISSTNEVINRTKEKLQKVHHQMVHKDSKKQITDLIRNLESELKQKDNWKQFEIHFDKVHENFLKQLRQQFPDLTIKDLKMAAYLRMNMTTKEIAQLFNMTYRGVETSRFRLRKKLQLSKNQNLTEFLMGIVSEEQTENQ